MTKSGLFESTFTVLPEWIDHNGHMNVAFYVLAFDLATDRVYEEWQIGDSHWDNGYSVFTLGMNVDYLSELFVGDEIRVTTQLLDCDHKRVHYFHTMYHAESGRVAATNECLGMCVSRESRRSAPFPDEIQSKLQSVLAADALHAQPDRAGRKLGIGR